jgi:hypothetical protein
MLRAPFFDPLKTYYENWEEGPFNDFADGVVFPTSEPRFEYLGRKISYPLGIAAGPLLNGRFVRAALEKGFDVPVYKTVRTREKKCNEWPNVLPVKVEGDLTLPQAARGLTIKSDYTEPLAITNSFGNPSYPTAVWQKDVRELMAFAEKRPGQMVCGMIEGTKWEASSSEQEFVDDWVLGARLMKEVGVHAIEANFSCPNEGDRVKKLLAYSGSFSELLRARYARPASASAPDEPRAIMLAAAPVPVFGVPGVVVPVEVPVEVPVWASAVPLVMSTMNATADAPMNFFADIRFSTY